ncbi:MAG TPA: glycosyltransferase family 9 protein [Nitrososphaera sp.]|nr:glycosyltransferase family 9 protein [Nitrososphaera sp.]
MHKIVVARACGIGDALQLTAFLRAINAIYPDAQVTVAVSSYAKPILENLNLRFTLMELPQNVMAPDRWRQFLGWLRFAKQIRARYDLGFFFVTPFTSSLVFKFCKIPVTVGLLTRSWKPFLPFTHILWIPKNPRDIQTPIGKIFLQALEALGRDATPFSLDYEYNVSKDEMQWASSVIGAAKSIRIGLCVQVGNEANPFKTKAYPIEQWISLINLLLHAGFEVFVFGKDKLGIEWNLDGVKDLTGRFTIRETAALMERMDVIVSADSGLLHLASAIGKRVIGLYGPTAPEVYGPIGKNISILKQRYPCMPCYRFVCEPGIPLEVGSLTKPYCMAGISPSVIFEEIARLVRAVD